MRFVQVLYFVLAALHMVAVVATGILLDPFYYWTRGWPMVLSLLGLACLVVGLLWTAAVLSFYAIAS